MEVSRPGAFEPIDLEIAVRLDSTGTHGVDHDQVGVVVLQIEMVEGMLALFAVAGCRLLPGWHTAETAVVDLQPWHET